MTRYFFSLILTLSPFFVNTVGAQNLEELRIRMRQALEHERAGNHDAAAALYRALLELHPGRADLSYRLAASYKKMGRHDDALAALDDRLARAPTDARARIHRADILISLGRKSEALLAIDEALSTARSPGLFVTVAETYRKQGLDDLAERAYRAARVALEDSTLFQREIAEVALAQGDHLTSVTEYVRFAAAKPQYIPLVELQLRDIATEADDPGRIAFFLTDRIRRDPDAHRIRLYVAFAQAAGLAKDAIDLLTSLPEGAPVAGSLLALGRHSLETRVYDIAAAAFDSLEERTTNDGIRTQARLGRARALEGLDLDDEASALYRSVSEARRRTRFSDEAAYRLSHLLTRHGNVDSARNVLERMLLPARHGKWRPLALFDLADLHVAAGRYPQAERVLSTVASEERGKEGSATAAFKRAEIDFMRLRFAKAGERLRMVTGGTKSFGAVNDAIALAHVLHVGSSRDSIGLRALAEGLRAERSGQLREALSILQKVTTAGGPLGDHNVKRQIGLLQRLQRSDAVVRACEQLAEDFPWSPFGPWALLTVGDVYRTWPGHTEEAVAAYERVLVLYGQSIEADEARARLKSLRHPTPPEGQPG